MKLSQLSMSKVKELLVLEDLQRLNERAGEELDGINIDDIDDESNIDVDLPDLSDEPTDEPIDELPKQTHTGFTVQNARDQLNGMVSRWFEIARSIPQEKREPFLKLGDRISEIIYVIESEFIDV